MKAFASPSCLLLGFVLVASGCIPLNSEVQMTTPAAGRHGDSPTEEEIETYLDGQPLPLPGDGKTAYKKGDTVLNSCLIRREHVCGLSREGSTCSNNSTRYTDAFFLYRGEAIPYAVQVRVEHRAVGQRMAFFGCEALSVRPVTLIRDDNGK